MAKKLAYNYRFDASAQTVTISGYYTLRKLVLITNVTDGAIIYNFADAGAGGTVSYNDITDETTISLVYNTTSMSDGDELQILIEDGQDTKIDAGESLIDPVHKFRVSNPENLIDTDFEYGLQASKWETLELVNNIPSVYSRDSNTSIPGISNIETTANSDSVSVTTAFPHQLAVGDPIEVRGTNSRTAEGKYLITAVPSTTVFRYRATEVQSTTANIKTVYTIIIPGSFFSGSTISFNKEEGIKTDGANPSTLTIKTDATHGLSTTTSLYITNSVGKQEFNIANQAATAADGDGVIDTTSNSIYLPSHNLYTGQTIHITNTSGSLPATAGGAPPPSGTSTIQSVYSTVNNTVTSIVDTLKANGEAAVFWMRNSGSVASYNNWFSHSIASSQFANQTDSGFQSVYFAEYDNTSHTFSLRSNTNYNTYYYFASNSQNSSSLFTGQPIDVGSFYTRSGSWATGAPANLSGFYYWQSTPFTDNSYTDYIVTVEQMQRPDVIAAQNGIRQYDYTYQQRIGTSAYRAYDSVSTSNSFNTSLGNGWRYNYAVTKWAPHVRSGTQNYVGYVYMAIHIDNTNWSGQYGNSVSWRNDQWNSMYTLDHRTFDYTGDNYRIGVLIPYMGNPSPNALNASSGSGVRYTYAQIAYNIASDIANAVGYPSFSGGTNSVQAVALSGDRIKLRNTSGGNEFGFTSTGSGSMTIETDQVTGVLDNYYTVTGTTSDTLTIAGQNQFSPRVLDFTNTDVISDSGENYITISGGHGIQNGQKVTFTGSGAAIGGIVNNTDYYAIVVDASHLQLAVSYDDALTRQNAISSLPSGGGSYSLSVYSINGTVAGIGLVDITDGNANITGTDTKFTTTFNTGDQFVVETTGGTVNSLISFTIETIVSDTELKLETAPGFAATGVNYYVSTKVHVRADGEFLHRPFDGGVDITAGKSPNSSIVRQTRKYFRYQSGKGIQCSMAINFNPSRPVRTASGSGSAITMTTEYPHGLVAGNRVRVSGAEEIKSLNPSTASYDPTTGLLTITIAGHGIVAGEQIYLTEESFNFQCAQDNYGSDHLYPRSTDPAGDQTRLTVKSVNGNDIVVDVGTSTYAGAHQIVSVAAGAVNHVDTSNAYNGTYEVTSSTEFTFSYTSSGTVTQADPDGFIEYAISGYKNAGIRAGLFDYQNGFFYEYDGKDLHCVRRSSVQQLSGTATVVNGSNTFTGLNTRFTKQVKTGDMIVVRGQSYKITAITDDSSIDIQPVYRGTSTSGAVITKTVDTRVKQADFNIDPVDGTGISGYNMDINKIQMAYMDYSWYGAGKIRFGFKDTYGHVKYVHEFIHNNRLNEAYMRTGNVPARYEAYNDGIPTFVPSLFHWGTSVIMDGGFDDDDSYLFTASGNPLIFTNGDSDTATTTGASFLRSTGWGYRRTWYVRLTFATSDASKFSAGTPMWSANTGGLNGEVVDSTAYGSGVLYVDIKVGTGFNAPASYPDVPSGTVVNIGAEAVGTSDVDLASNIPLISVRLAPSADNNLIGELGERDIINRMQLKMKELGISVSHDTNVSLILNGNLSNLTYQNVGAPSLTQYVAHEAGDTITGGITIYSFRASGGSEDASGKRLVASEFFDISSLVDLGNSIIGGNGVFPDGPDIITVACNVINTSEIDSTSAFKVSSRISWAESQA